MALLLSLAVCSIFLVGFVTPVAIDNGLEGEPEIGCGSDRITVNFNTRNTFEGHVYVKGRFEEPTCKNSERGKRVATLELKFSDCGVKRERSANPRGVFVSTTVVITFHPQFLTKIDRVYKLQCFYMEADKTVTTELEVSMLTTAFRTETVPMPVCRYEILDQGPQGEVVKYVLVGQQVYHKWTCTTETTNTFCMSVYSCFVDDGKGDRIDLINEQGCAIDGNLLNNIDYMNDLMGGVEAHVFKYADRPNLYFNCQIRITVKEPDVAECPRTQCPAPNFTNGKKRKRRSVTPLAIDDTAAAVVDVSPQDVEVLDLDIDTPVTHGLRHIDTFPLVRSNESERRVEERGICISPAAFGFVAVAGVAVLASLFAFTFYVLSNKRKQ